MWRQTRDFDPAKAGQTKGWCLQNVRLGYGIPPKYTNAIGAWNNTQQHKNKSIPLGVEVPLYYTYRTDGHINVRLSDGRIWNDGEYYAHLDHYLSTHSSVGYLGWGESVNNVRVIEELPDPVLNMPPIGSTIQLLPIDTRSTFKAGTTIKAGTLNVTNNTFYYVVRGYDPKYPNRVLINSSTAGGNSVALALYFTNGAIVPKWRKV